MEISETDLVEEPNHSEDVNTANFIKESNKNRHLFVAAIKLELHAIY